MFNTAIKSFPVSTILYLLPSNRRKAATRLWSGKVNQTPTVLETVCYLWLLYLSFLSSCQSVGQQWGRRLSDITLITHTKIPLKFGSFSLECLVPAEIMTDVRDCKEVCVLVRHWPAGVWLRNKLENKNWGQTVIMRINNYQ